MDAIIKEMSEAYGAMELVLFRSLFGLIPVVIIIMMTGRISMLATRRPGLQALRAILATVTTFLFFLSLQYLPLGEAVALVFAAPIFLTVLAGPVLGEKVGPRRWFAVAVGFVGVLTILRPGSDVFSPYALLPVSAALTFSFTMLLGRKLALTDNSTSIVFYTSVGGVLASAVLVPMDWITPTLDHFPWLLLIGILGGVGQLLIVQAFRYAEASMLAPFEYTCIVWAILFGYLIWSELPDQWTVVGASIVIASGLYIAQRESRARRAG
jgi:drug/metabolite transporter (DMT)-like permease